MAQKFAFCKGFDRNKKNVTVYSQDIHNPVKRWESGNMERIIMRIIIEKALRRLRVTQDGRELFACPVGLGRAPEGAKQASGDGRTPEGSYFICLVKENGKYGRSLGLSYPGPEDAENALKKGLIDQRTFDNILLAHREHRRPPWGSPMGGEIFIHEGGAAEDWTQGCIALETRDMDRLFALYPQVDEVRIVP